MQLYQNSRFPCQSFRFFVQTPGAQCGIGKWELDPGPPMRRRSSASEGRFGAAEPEGCASIRVVGRYQFAALMETRLPAASIILHRERIEDSMQSSPRHLLQYVTGRAAGKRHNETPTVRKTPPLPLRPMLRELQPPAPDSAREDVSPPQGNTGPLPWRRGFQPRHSQAAARHICRAVKTGRRSV